MKRQTLSLIQLAVLESVARTGSVGATAQELGLSQPSVSNHIAQTERRLAVKLLIRNGHQFRPTPRLAALLPKMRAMLKLSEDIAGVLRDHAALDSGTLSIGYSTHQFVIGALKSYIGRFPGVQLAARSAGSFDLLQDLRRGTIEAAFVTLAEPEPDLVCHLIREEPIVLMVAPDHPLLARGGPVAWPEVAGMGLIRREAASGTRRAFDAMAARQGMVLRTALDLGSWESLREAAAQGMGAAIAMLGEIEAADSRVRTLRIGPPEPRVGHYLVSLPDFAQTAPVAALFDIVAQGWRSFAVPAEYSQTK